MFKIFHVFNVFREFIVFTGLNKVADIMTFIASTVLIDLIA